MATRTPSPAPSAKGSQSPRGEKENALWRFIAIVPNTPEAVHAYVKDTNIDAKDIGVMQMYSQWPKSNNKTVMLMARTEYTLDDIAASHSRLQKGLEAKFADQQAQITQMQAQITQLQAAIVDQRIDFEAKLAQQQAQIAQQQAQITQQQAQITQLQARITGLATNIAQLQAPVTLAQQAQALLNQAFPLHAPAALATPAH